MSITTRPRGRFITFEGIDGAGKSTHLAWFTERVRARIGAGRVVMTREPGGTPLGETLRDLLLSRPMHPDTEALLMFAARREHLDQVIVPALERGDWVICDRFTDASYAYQCGGRGIAPERLALLERYTHADLQPDRTFLFDLEPRIAEQRRAAARAADRFEAEARAFHERTRAAYLARAREFPRRIVRIDSEQSIDDIRKQLEENIAIN